MNLAVSGNPHPSHGDMEEEDIDVVSPPSPEGSHYSDYSSTEEGNLIIAEPEEVPQHHHHHPASVPSIPRTSSRTQSESSGIHSVSPGARSPSSSAERSESAGRSPAPVQSHGLELKDLHHPENLKQSGAGNNISKLESLVNNLLKSKTDSLSLPHHNSVVDSTACPEKMVVKATTEALAERRKSSKPRKTRESKKSAPDSPMSQMPQVPNAAQMPGFMQNPMNGMMMPGMPSPLMPFGCPMPPMGFGFPGMPMQQMPGMQMPHMPGMPGGLPGGLPGGMPGGLPGMSPFLPMNLAMGLHPFMMGLPGMPMMPPAPAGKTPAGSPPPASCAVKKEPREDTTTPERDADSPLDLSGNRKRKHTGEERFESPAKTTCQEGPLNLSKIKTEGLSSPAPSLSPQSGHLSVLIPRSAHGEMTAGMLITPPKPSSLPRTGASAFSSYSPKQEPASPVKVDPAHSPVPAPGRVKEASVYEHKVLQTDFLQAIQKEPAGSGLHKLHQSYRREVDAIETERYKALDMYAKDETQKEMLGSYFDHQRLLTARQYRSMLNGATMKSAVPPNFPLPVGMNPMVQSPFSLPTSPMTDVSGRMNSTPPWKPADGKNSSSPSTPSPDDKRDPHGLDISVTSPPGDDEGHKRRKFLSAYAVSILTDWYETHYDHPYPTDAAVEDLAERAQITTSQVKKWMANKRVRSCNTLAFNGSIHPKKLEKLLQLKEAAQQDGTPSPVPSENRSPNSGLDDPGSSEKKRSKRLLNPASVEALNRWYFEHISYPYPTEEQKKLLADETTLSVAQVTCWFANKRNRSNNTRKITTKQMWQKLNRKLEIYESIQRGKGPDMSDLPTMVPMSMPGVVELPTQRVPPTPDSPVSS